MPAPRHLLERANVHLKFREYALAENVLRRALASAPGDWQVNHWLAESLFFQGKLQQAMTFAASAARAAGKQLPQRSASLGVLGQCQMKLMKLDEALQSLAEAAELAPQEAMHWNALGVCYMMREELELALPPLERALALTPDDAVVLINYARVLGDHAQVDKAYAILRGIHERDPRDVEALNHLVSKTGYIADLDPAEKLTLARRMGALMQQQLQPDAAPLHRVTDRGADRPLRIGLVSYDFRKHSCAYFVRPILKHVERRRASLHCFMTCNAPDATTAHLQQMLQQHDTWTDISGKPPREQAQLIAQQRIDVLVELGGYTVGSGVDACVFRPSPLIVTALGYPGTLGVPAITHRLVDSVTDSPMSDAWFSESLVRLPQCFVCYDPGTDIPQSARPPLADDAPIRFGSFNATVKITQPTLHLWASVLRAVPNSTLLLKGHTLGGVVSPAFLKSELQRRGVDPTRVTCMGRVDDVDHHLRVYDRIDIALETYPYHGTTTTCEALMMGVPVITLAGREHVSRVGVSLLTHAGLPELIADTSEQYVRIATQLASDRPRLRSLHASLRQHLLASPLCDGPAYARRWLDALHALWMKPVGS